MPNKLTDFINTSLAQGQTQQTIEGQLLNAGWTKEHIQEGFLEVNSHLNKTQIQETVQAKGSGMKKILLYGIIVVLTAAAAGGGYYGYKNYLQKPTETQNSQKTAENSSKQDENIVDDVIASSKKWEECAYSDNASDYLAPQVNDFNLTSAEAALGGGQIGKYSNGVSEFLLTIKKNSETDINRYWSEQITAYAKDNVGNIVNGSTLLSSKAQQVNFQDALIYTTKGQTVGENLVTTIIILIPAHQMAITITTSSPTEKTGELAIFFQKWFESVCK